jgi:hypothetical protein
MKKCAKCDTEYDDAYDGCPACANRPPAMNEGDMGFCSECGHNIWVEAGGVCPSGHGADCVSEAHVSTGVKCPVCESIVPTIDPCPICVRDAKKAAGQLYVTPKGVGCFIVIALILAAGWGMQSCMATGAALNADNPALAAKARAAIVAVDATAADLIDTITAKMDGTVIITLNQTAATLAGSAGANGAEKLGAAYNALVLAKVPEATSVSTFDANNEMLELSTRK